MAPFGGSTHKLGGNQEKTQGKAQGALRCAYRKRTALHCNAMVRFFSAFPKEWLAALPLQPALPAQ